MPTERAVIKPNRNSLGTHLAKDVTKETGRESPRRFLARLEFMESNMVLAIVVVIGIILFLWMIFTWPEQPKPKLKEQLPKKLVLWPDKEVEPPATDLGRFAKQPPHCEPFSTEEFNKYLDALYDPKNQNHLE